MRNQSIFIFLKRIFTFCGCFLCILAGSCLAAAEGCFKLCPWQVGQFVEYQIISLENEGADNRYAITITGKERVENRDYYRIKLDIYEQRKRQISFEGLVEPFNEKYFAEHPDVYIAKGMMFLFENARRLFVELPDNSCYEISPQNISNPPDILSGTFYKEVPDEKNRVDYSKLNFRQEKDNVSVPAGSFDCYRFWVQTEEDNSYTDEGFIMWRSPEVPFLGIVKMEFSKTEYFNKNNYRYLKILDAKNWLLRFYTLFFIKKVSERERSDSYTIKLINYGIEKHLVFKGGCIEDKKK